MPQWNTSQSLLGTASYRSGIVDYSDLKQSRVSGWVSGHRSCSFLLFIPSFFSTLESSIGCLRNLARRLR